MKLATKTCFSEEDDYIENNVQNYLKKLIELWTENKKNIDDQIAVMQNPKFGIANLYFGKAEDSLMNPELNSLQGARKIERAKKPDGYMVLL